MEQILLSVSDEGILTAIYSDELAPLLDEGRAHIERASFVEPNSDGKWEAAIVGGPVLGPFTLRSEALAAEVEYLNQKMF